MSCFQTTALLPLLALASCSAFAEFPTGPIPGQWSGAIQTGIAQGMQLSLGGLFNPGPAHQSRLTIQGNNVLRRGDQLQMYGWQTTDLRKNTTDADIGVRYRARLHKVAGGTLVGGTGLEYWHFPSVLGGARDLALDSYLGWSGGEKIPITISGNGKTILRSHLPHGTMGIFQVQHTQKLYSFARSKLTLQHGPIYVYNWDLYGKPGHRVLRYCASLQLGGAKWAVEGLFRPQAGLQPRIPDNNFWSASIIRRF